MKGDGLPEKVFKLDIDPERIKQLFMVLMDFY